MADGSGDIHSSKPGEIGTPAIARNASPVTWALISRLWYSTTGIGELPEHSLAVGSRLVLAGW